MRISDWSSDVCNADGFRVGAGVEQLFGPTAYGKLEYRYSNYSNLEHNREGTTDLSRNIDLDRHQVVAGVGFRFYPAPSVVKHGAGAATSLPDSQRAGEGKGGSVGLAPGG